MIKIEDKTQCCGCSGCSNACPKSCITMIEDEEGFLYPHIDSEQCINCGLCEKVCPILNYEKRECNLEQKAAIVQHKNEEILRQSTAGGAFTAIAEYVIEKNGIVFGVEMDSNFFVHHIAVETKEELAKFRNSKYVQSYIGDTYKNVEKEIQKGRLVCFSGTPCQIEGLRKYLRKEYENLLLVDVVCRAVPSPGIWKKYIELIQKEIGKLKSVRFRDKSLGYQYSTMEIKNLDGNTYRGGIENQFWLRMFFSGMIIRPSCTQCKFRSQYRFSDFTIWDCFNIYQINRKFDEQKGTTRVLLHTKRAVEIFAQIEDKILCEDISPEIAVKGVREMQESPQMHEKRNQFVEDLNTKGIEFVQKKYFPITISCRIKSLLRRILNFLGLDKLIKHILKKG